MNLERVMPASGTEAVPLMGRCRQLQRPCRKGTRASLPFLSSPTAWASHWQNPTKNQGVWELTNGSQPVWAEGQV